MNIVQHNEWTFITDGKPMKAIASNLNLSWPFFSVKINSCVVSFQNANVTKKTRRLIVWFV